MSRNAIVPVNVTALRVSINDQSNLVSKFKGRTAAFQKMPHTSGSKVASTGQQVVVPLESLQSSSDSLFAGIHLHWELPDVYRRGTQPAEGGDVVFPHAPNRWLVIRYLSSFDTESKEYGQVKSKMWIVESDYVSLQQQVDADNVVRPTVPVPLPVRPSPGTQPYMYMGRVVEYEKWNPNEPAENYLPHFNGLDDKPLYLTSIGFVGPSFSSYYQECCSVFGFWDRFNDNQTVYDAIQQGGKIKFRTTYQIFGWNHDPSDDPLVGIEATVTSRYADYVQQCQNENVAVKTTPADEFAYVAENQLKWAFHEQDIEFTLISDTDKALRSITTPQRTLCAGVIQEVVWDLDQPGTMFLNNPPGGTQGNPLWTDSVELAVGNTTVEGLSALIKHDIAESTNDPNLLTNYEYLLDALQLGMLHNLEQNGNSLITLEEACHTRAFSQTNGGYLWVVEGKQTGTDVAVDAGQQITLPLTIAEYLHVLNQAQKNYDQGRAALDAMRKQLFMDWFQWVNAHISGDAIPNVDTQTLGNFVYNPNDDQCELQYVVDYGNKVGIIYYEQDPVTSQITGVQKPADLGSLAGIVWIQLQTVVNALADHPEWEIRAAPAAPFFSPTDPVVVMEGDRLEPVRRNGTGPNTPVRLSTELLSSLSIAYNGSSFTIAADRIQGQPTITNSIPLQQDVTTLVGESQLLTPMLAAGVAAALKAQGGTGTDNPAVASEVKFIASLNAAQGGLSPLESGYPSQGLFAFVHDIGVKPTSNPTVNVDSPQKIGVTFTNTGSRGWAPDAIAWSAQAALPAFGKNRVDPFLPVFLIWTVRFDPLKRNAAPDYDAGNLTGLFELNPGTPIDYDYFLDDDNQAKFTTGNAVEYTRSVVLSRKPTSSLTAQIDMYEKHYPADDQADPSLTRARDEYSKRKIMSQALSGFNIEQTLRTYIARVAVEDLVQGNRDPITKTVNDKATANKLDDWYDFAFNSQIPIPFGLPAQLNFGPLRSGFLEIKDLEIVDVFGQRMRLDAGNRPDGSLEAVPSFSLQPVRGDTSNAGKIYLPPRMLAPTRMWFNWLSATHDSNVGGISGDFVEMNSHPSTSPVCGWIVPNHLDDSLFFYDADGKAIGSFGVEHGQLKYRTRAGNIDNQHDQLEDDIGPFQDGPPLVNLHVFNFMWYIQKMNDPKFLKDLMTTIENSDKFINPANFAQDVSLAVLIGRPLALTRAVIGMETLGNVLPINQANVNGNEAFPNDVNKGLYKYADRQAASSSALGDVRFPVQLGDLADIDDGLVGYLIEAGGQDPYSAFYSPAAPAGGKNRVVQPTADTIELTLNAQAIPVTMLIDPRAAVHATTGVLPVANVRIPSDQYSQAMNSLAVTFFTHPILKAANGFVVPLPQESGYNWSWVSPGNPDRQALKANAANEFAKYGYSPQTALEGWLRLSAEIKE